MSQGGCVIGKSNMDEFCMGTSSSQSFFGPVKSPYREMDNDDGDWHIPGGSPVKSPYREMDNDDGDWRIPGGSSGGSAVAVLLGAAHIGLGSDTGGSTRNPAAMTGLVGLKPSYGLLSRHGLVPLVNSLDVPAIFSRTVADCDTMLGLLSGRDPFDSTSVEPLSTIRASIRKSLQGLTIGIPLEYNDERLSPDAWRAWNRAALRLKRRGCRIVSLSLPHTEYSIVCYHVIGEADIASNMARYDGVRYGHRSDKNQSSTHAMYAASRSEAFNEVVRRRILAGNYFLMKKYYDEYFLRAMRIRRLISDDFNKAFISCDALLAPVTSGSAPRHSEMIEGDYERERHDDYYTQPANLAGIPAISVPMGNDSNGLPIGVQVMAPWMQDGLVISIAQHLHEEDA